MSFASKGVLESADLLQPTIVYEAAPAAEAPAARSSDVSQAHIGLLKGTAPHFADETAGLLRARLTAAAWVLAVVLAAVFVGNWVNGAPLIWLRVAILVVLFGSVALLRSSRPLNLTHLRVIEGLIFGAVVVQASLMMLTRIAHYAALGDAVSAVAVEQAYVAAWCVIVLTYGIFLPNTWRRGAAVMLPVACLPYVLIALQKAFSSEVAAVLSRHDGAIPIPLPLVAAAVGIYGAYVINSARREAYKARQFGQYRLGKRLGHGGMGEVYQAEHVLLKRPCAIKTIRRERETDAATLAQFEKEVRTTARLTHWNTVEIFDFGYTSDGTFYYVMELLPGMSLEDLVEAHGPLPPARVVRLLVQVCDALREAHAIGLVHRDIKPANIFASQRGGIWDVAKLLDFGLVKAPAPSGEAAADRTGGFSGTPLYMAPEQAKAYESVDARTDIYALGAVAFFLLTGEPPFTGAGAMDIINAHATRPVAPPSKINPNIPPDLEQVVVRCLAKRPQERFPNVVALGAALASCQCAGQWTSVEADDWWNKVELGSRPS
jgi:serine/threonine-protein kinase